MPLNAGADVKSEKRRAAVAALHGSFHGGPVKHLTKMSASRSTSSADAVRMVKLFMVFSAGVGKYAPPTPDPRRRQSPTERIEVKLHDMPSDDERPPGPTTLARRDARVERAELERARTARDRAIAALSDAFAHDVLDVEEFERRVTVAHTSEASAEILALIADLPASTDAIARVPVALAQAEPTTIGEAATTQTVYAIMGGVDRRGAWTVPQRWRVIAMMGGAQLDLREARFPAGVIDLEVKAVFGGVQIIVPPGLAVEVHGTAIMGGFQNVNRAPAHPDPDAPLLRVH